MTVWMFQANPKRYDLLGAARSGFDDNWSMNQHRGAVTVATGCTSSSLVLRSTGLRYAQTVLRTRLVKVATGIKSLPGSEIKNTNIRIIGWRDQMTPQQRQEKAANAMGNMFQTARPADAPAMSAAELRTIEGEDSEFGGVPSDDVVQEAMKNPGHLNDRERFEQATTTLDASTMTQEEMEEAIANEYEEAPAAVSQS